MEVLDYLEIISLIGPNIILIIMDDYADSLCHVMGI